MKLVHDTWLIYRRSLMLTVRNPMWIFIGLTQPIFYLVLFAPLLNGLPLMPGTAPGHAYETFVPGLLILMAMFGTAFVGFGLVAELRAGVVERMRVTPLSRLAMLLGRALRDVTIMLGQALLLVLLSIPFGLAVDPAGVAMALALVALVGLVLAPLSYALGLALKTEDGLAAVVNVALLPMLLLSGILLPLALAPDWLRTVASLDPLSHAVEASRALFDGRFADPAVLPAIVLIGLMAAGALWIGSRAFGRAVA